MSSVEGLLLSVEQSVHLAQEKAVDYQEHSRFWDTLFNNLNYNFEAVYYVIDSILTAKDRCVVTPLYIQAIAINQCVFLVSNADCFPHFKLTATGTAWLLGHSSSCALTLPQATLDACHASIGYSQFEGFHLIDLGSRLGTYLNHKLMFAQEKYLLKDGDVIQFGQQRLEFFMDDFDQPDTCLKHGLGVAQDWTSIFEHQVETSGYLPLLTSLVLHTGELGD